MKKFIQICSILSLLFMFSVVSARAQTVSRYEAKIPFDFNIGQKSYKQGTYLIKIEKLSDSCSALILEGADGNELQKILAAGSSTIAKKQPELVFNRYENQRFLNKMLTPDTGISIPASSAEERISKKLREKNSRVQAALVKMN